MHTIILFVYIFAFIDKDYFSLISLYISLPANDGEKQLRGHALRDAKMKHMLEVLDFI